jgi:hypothetical protein
MSIEWIECHGRTTRRETGGVGGWVAVGDDAHYGAGGYSAL